MCLTSALLYVKRAKAKDALDVRTKCWTVFLNLYRYMLLVLPGGELSSLQTWACGYKAPLQGWTDQACRVKCGPWCMGRAMSRVHVHVVSPTQAAHSYLMHILHRIEG